MSSGTLKHRITFLKLDIQVNENGFETESYSKVRMVWAAVSNLSGREYFSAAAIQKEKTVKFKIRAIKGIDETMKIDFLGRRYNITSIDNIRYENKYIEIKSLESDEYV